MLALCEPFQAGRIAECRISNCWMPDRANKLRIKSFEGAEVNSSASLFMGLSVRFFCGVNEDPARAMIERKISRKGAMLERKIGRAPAVCTGRSVFYEHSYRE